MNGQFLYDILQLSIVQIILVACIGALLGEIKKEVDDEESIVLTKFIVTWLCSGFGGVMVGLILEGTFAKDNTYLVLGGSGMAGFVGQQKSLALSYKLLTLFVNSSSEETKPKKRNKTRTKKKNDDNQP